jgi:uncharacterized protein YbjT (DUF2867 family)
MKPMKIVIIGGTGRVGSNVAGKLSKLGHTVIAGAPATGINSLTGEGLDEAMAGTDIVIDLSNSPSFEDGPVMDFFQNSGRNLVAAEKRAGIKHHVVLSIVGVDQMPNVGYMRAKKAQEDIIRQSGLPYTIIHSTQFIEFIPDLANGSIQGNEAHISDVAFQPITAEDVASFVAEFALAEPANGIRVIAGPERHTLSEFVAIYLKESGNPATVVTNHDDMYYGGHIPNDALVPHGEARLGAINFEQWLSSKYAKS